MIDQFRLRLEKLDHMISSEEESDPEVSQLDNEISQEINKL